MNNGYMMVIVAYVGARLIVLKCAKQAKHILGEKCQKHCQKKYCTKGCGANERYKNKVLREAISGTKFGKMIELTDRMMEGMGYEPERR